MKKTSGTKSLIRPNDLFGSMWNILLRLYMATMGHRLTTKGSQKIVDFVLILKNKVKYTDINVSIF